MKTTLEKIIDFNDELNEYSYGLVYNNQSIEITMDDSLFDKYYKTLSYDEFEKYKCGVCWDYTSYEAMYFKKNFPDVFYETYFFIEKEEDGKINTHTCLIFFMGKKVYYFESSWYLYQGIYEFFDKKECLNFIIENFKTEYSVFLEITYFRYNALDKNLIHKSTEEFINYLME